MFVELGFQNIKGFTTFKDFSYGKINMHFMKMAGDDKETLIQCYKSLFKNCVRCVLVNIFNVGKAILFKMCFLIFS